MNKKIVIHEKFSKNWPTIALLSGILSIILWGTYLSISDILLSGYLRLGAFAFFTLTILSLFKIKDGKVIIEIENTEAHEATVHYTLRQELVFTEIWDMKKIAGVKISEMPNKSLYNDIVTGDRCVMVRKQNEMDWIYFNTLFGRVIPFKKDNAERIKQYLEKFLDLN